jgi:hypothetical protein
MELKDIERRFGHGEAIVERGHSGRELFVVREGNVLLQWHEGEAPHLLAAGDVFGETAAILGRPYSFQAEADGEAAVLAIDRPLLNRLCSECPEFVFRLIRHLAQHADAWIPEAAAEVDATPVPPLIEAEPEVEAMHEPAEDLHAHVEDTTRAFANALLEQAVGEDAPLPVKGRLAELAEVAGLEMMDAYVCLQALLDRRLLRLVDDQLTILEPDQLREMSS